MDAKINSKPEVRKIISDIYKKFLSGEWSEAKTREELEKQLGLKPWEITNILVLLKFYA